MKTRLIIFSLGCLLLAASCADKVRQEEAKMEEDAGAKKLLQGVWLNEDENNVAFRVEGDSIFYPDSTSQPVSFYIYSDTLVMQGSNEVKYPIVKQAAHIFQFKNQNGDVVKLVKTEDESYLQSFERQRPVALNQQVVVKRDTVVSRGSDRYHLYVQVNPTSYKVFKTVYNDEGVEVDNVYYDNIININIFRGAQKVFSRDFRKQDFTKKVPDSFLRQAILSDLVFRRIDESGIHYLAVLAMPDSSLSYQVEIVFSFDGKYRILAVGA